MALLHKQQKLFSCILGLHKYTPPPLAEGSSVGSIEVLREKVADAFVEGRKEGAPVGNADGIPLGSIEGCNVGSIVSV